MMTFAAALVALAILAALAVFQLALIAGVPIGRFAWGGQNRVLPVRLRIASAVAIVLYGAFALFIAQRVGLLEALPAAVADIGIWVIAGYLILGVLANIVSKSRSERLVMTPVALVLCGAVFVVAMGSAAL